MKVKLLDTRLIHGVYIDRSKNRHRNCYTKDETLTNSDNLVYKMDEEEGKQKSNEKTKIIQLDIQVSSNLRLVLEHKRDPEKLFFGAPKYITSYNEKHFLRFERYIDMPEDMRVLK